MGVLRFDHRDCFGADYFEARARFVEAAREAGASLDAIAHPLRGPAGEALSVDVARIGPRSADRVLIAQSGTHGVELMCGSGGQTSWLRNYQRGSLPNDTAVVLVHGINPHGAARDLRETEEGVDLNRNLRDHSIPPPPNPGYRALHDALLCPELEGPKRAVADRALDAYLERHGEARFWNAVGGGQYTHPLGLYYGGTELTWAARTFQGLLEANASVARRVAFIDLHSGLGPFGYGTIIHLGANGSPDLERANAWFGKSVVAPFAGGMGIPQVQGHMAGAVERVLHRAEVTSIALEFGTFDSANDLRTHRDRLWLRDHGTYDDALGLQIRNAFRKHFFPGGNEWTEAVAFRTVQVMDQALTGLAE